MTNAFTFKNHRQESRLFSQRLFGLSLMIALFSSILIIRLAYLQLVQHHAYMTLSKQNLLDLIPIEPKRGLIYDRNGVLLAENKPVYNLEVVPGNTTHLKTTLHALTQLLHLTPEELTKFHRLLKQHRRFSSIPLREKLVEQDIATFYVNQHHFNGVSIKTRMIRHYPHHATFAHVIGYVSNLNEQELQQIDRTNYSATQHIGKIGIEKSFESLLHGQVGYEEVETDASGRIIRTLSRQAPQSGDHLHLTIDSRLMAAANKALGEKRGAVVAIQPATGQILALVSTPNYDPNLFVTGLNNETFYALQNANQPLYNRALRGQYPPGSTIKPLLALGSLEAHFNAPQYQIFDQGWYRLAHTKHIYHDWKDEGHGWIDLSRAITVSCDTYFYDLAFRLGIQRIDSILESFGLGKKTGIELGEELTGLLPSPAWKQAMHHKPWYPGDTLISGIGQGYMLATPLQLAVATATLAMKGQYTQPTLLLPTKQTTHHLHTPLSMQVLTRSNANWQTIFDAMRRVVTDPDGTGRRFGRNPPYTTAAKTGSSQVFSKRWHKPQEELPEKLRDHSLFIAFAPIEKPEIALAVVVENSFHAPIVARHVLDAYFTPRS